MLAMNRRGCDHPWRVASDRNTQQQLFCNVPQRQEASCWPSWTKLSHGRHLKMYARAQSDMRLGGGVALLARPCTPAAAHRSSMNNAAPPCTTRGTVSNWVRGTSKSFQMVDAKVHVLVKKTHPHCCMGRMKFDHTTSTPGGCKRTKGSG